MEKLSGRTLKNLWESTRPGFEENSEHLRKIEYSLNCLCDVIDQTPDEIEKGELLFGGLERLLDSGTKAYEIKRSHRFMKLLTGFGVSLMNGQRKTDGFYLGMFCELRLSRAWHDVAVLKTLKNLFHLVRTESLRLPHSLKEKLLIKLKKQDEKLFYRFYPRTHLA